jgi:hypothetical protein
MRTFAILGTIDVEDAGAIVRFLERLGSTEASVAKAIRSEIVANLDDALDHPRITLIVEEAPHFLRETECFDESCGDSAGHWHRRIELS